MVDFKNLTNAKCRLCKRTDGKNNIRVAYVNINFKAIPVCEMCLDSLLSQSIKFNLDNKWETYWVLRRNEEGGK